MSEPRQRFRPTFAALSDPVPVSVRLRRTLKSKLRGCGFRCVKLEELPPERSRPMPERVPSNDDLELPENLAAEVFG
jgi:hypothetical protein